MRAVTWDLRLLPTVCNSVSVFVGHVARLRWVLVQRPGPPNDRDRAYGGAVRQLRIIGYGSVVALVLATGCTSGSRDTNASSSTRVAAITVTRAPVLSTSQVAATTVTRAPVLSTSQVAATTVTQVPELSASQIAQAVTRPATVLTRGFVAITRCASQVDSCSQADQRTAQDEVLAVKVLADNIKALQASNRVPEAVKALLDDTGNEANAIVDLSVPDTQVFACGPGSSTWPDSQVDCAKRYQALGRAARKLVDTLQQWDNFTG